MAPIPVARGVGVLSDFQVPYRLPVVQLAPTSLVLLSVIALALGVAGDLASCERIPLPFLWASLLTGCYYVAIVVAAVGFGYRVGVAAALLAGLVHGALRITVCTQSISQQGEVAAFIVVGLLAGLPTKYARKRTTSSFPQSSPAAQADSDRGQRAWNAQMVGSGHIPPSFLRAFRNPLAAIQSAGYVLEEPGLTGENHREVAVIILKECQRLDVLARSLEFVEPRSPEYRQVELSSLLGEIVRLAIPVTEAASIQIRRAEAPVLRLVCDPDLIQQAVLNIVTNAIRIVRQGDEVMLSAHIDKGEAMIEDIPSARGRIWAI